MKGIAALTAALLLCTACSPLRLDLLYTVPESHVFQKSIVVPNADLSRVDLVRDFAIGHGYKLRIWVDSVAVADIANREKLTFYVPPGHHLVALGDLEKPGKQWGIDVPPGKPLVLFAREVAGGWGGTKLERLP